MSARDDLRAHQAATLNGSGAAPSFSPTVFFDGSAFVPSRLGEWLRERWPTATGARQLYAFRDGIYRPSEDFLRERIAETLGSQWRARRADETISYLLQTSQALWEAPPLDRIAVRNGILTVADRTLNAASAAFLSPIRINASYEPTATCPKIDRFLEQVFPGGAELLYEAIGHLMVPESRQRAFMFLGPGGNGKSTALRLTKTFLGRENVSAVGLHALEENRFAAADLYGKLANIYADLDARALTATGIFKSITGGDPIRGERKHRDAFEFIAYARLIFSANEPPPTSDSSQAFFDRWIIVPFQQRIRGSTRERQQDELLADLTTPDELSGLLNHALAALGGLRRTGHFTTSKTTDSAAENFRVAADSAAGFLHEHCAQEISARVARSELWHAYRSWCDENNRRALSSQRFHGRVRELVHDLDEVTVTGTRSYIGIRLKATR